MNAAGPLAQRIAAAGLDWIVPQWPAPRGVHAFVTTRNGGASVGAAASLDLGGASPAIAPAEAAAIAENRRRVEAFLPAPPSWLAQVHGTDVVIRCRRCHSPRTSESLAAITPATPICSDDHELSPPRADAAVTFDTDVVLAVRIADCMPVLFADTAGCAIGIAHAGWRGLAAGVLENTIAAMSCAPSRIVAWLGPAIGRRAFEVGADVRDAFVRTDLATEAAFGEARPGKWLADLESLARMRLIRAGVSSISGGDMCTASDPARFFSFRRDRGSGRMAAFLWREEARQ
jgi:polyphenol oxidase